MSIERYYGQYTPVCDYCGARLPGEESFDAAVRAKREAMRRSLYLILYVLIDKHDAPLEDIQRLSDEVNYLADSIVKGYVTWRDIERVVVDDYGVSLPW